MKLAGAQGEQPRGQRLGPGGQQRRPDGLALVLVKTRGESDAAQRSLGGAAGERGEQQDSEAEAAVEHG